MDWWPAILWPIGIAVAVFCAFWIAGRLGWKLGWLLNRDHWKRNSKKRS